MDAWSTMSLEDQIRQAVEQAVPDSTVEVVANGSHFSLKVISPVFEGKKTPVSYTHLTLPTKA